MKCVKSIAGEIKRVSNKRDSPAEEAKDLTDVELAK